jgi:hypothetical protein
MYFFVFPISPLSFFVRGIDAKAAIKRGFYKLSSLHEVKQMIIILLPYINIFAFHYYTTASNNGNNSLTTVVRVLSFPHCQHDRMLVFFENKRKASVAKFPLSDRG